MSLNNSQKPAALPANAIAITGLAGRFPGAPDLDAFWKNLCGSVESLRRFTADELTAIAPAISERAEYVPVRGVLDQAACFDASFFGVSPREAEVMDPQHRVFLECCWHALEDSGRICDRRRLVTGVFAGQSLNTYLLSNLARDRAWLEKFTAAHQTGEFATLFGNDKDYLATRVAHKLDLHGPAITVQTACSTSLVAVVQAVQSLLAHQCDLCLAGGVSISFPQQRGHLYEEGAMVSKDGACRPFDADAAGTVFGAGAGVVVLRRLEDAVADGDRIYAVIRGAAVNNDGAAKSSYTAPSVEGQAEVITTALVLADVPAETIGYVEAHGTGTPLGDPIEVAALSRAFRDCGARANAFCALGSLKGNIGHLEAGAGIAGLIKAALAVQQGVLPPTLNFKSPNPRVDFANSPFFVSGESRAWPQAAHPRRAGVSSFGVGGTNAHVVLEQAPAMDADTALAPMDDRPAVALLSAKSAEALSNAATRLADHVETHADIEPADVAATLQDGREVFRHRLAVVAHDRGALMRALRDASAPRRHEAEAPADTPPVVFMFPGQGAQRAGMARDLYRAEPVFRETVDECARFLETRLECDIRELLLAESSDNAAAEKLRQTKFTQPCIFTTELALARLWQSWGVEPAALIGHSVGEYVAATLAGVFSLEDALIAVAERGALVQALPSGAMLAVRLTPSEIEPRLPAGTSIAAINAPGLCVVAGPEDAIAALEKALEAEGKPGKRLATSHAFHSPMMDPIIAPLGKLIAGFKLGRAAIPIASTVSGNWLGASEAADANYWAQHARRAVRFADGLETILSRGPAVLLEVGPGRTLLQLARLHAKSTTTVDIVASLPLASEKTDGAAEIAEAAARLWTRGISVDWRARERGARRRIVSLPGYPFARTVFWMEPPALSTGSASSLTSTALVAAAPAPAAATTAVVETRPARVERELLHLLESVYGSKLESAQTGRCFFDFGFDSLLLTQVAAVVRERFGVVVTFRQLLERFTSPAELAAHLESALPENYFASAESNEPMVEPAPSAEAADHAAGDLVEEVVAQQLAIMEQQLAVLRGAGRDGKSSNALRARIAALSGSAAKTPAPAPAPATTPTQKTPVVAAPAPECAPELHAETEEEKRVPLTEEQREVWLACQLGPLASASFNESCTLRLRGAVDREALAGAVRRVVARHEALRAIFAADGSAQVIQPSINASLVEADVPADDAGAEAWLRAEAARPFDLEHGPLVRFHFVRRSEETWLVFSVHHLVCDGWSCDIILHDLGLFYGTAAHGDISPATEEATQISTYAADEPVRSAAPEARASRDYWKRKLENPPAPVELPADRTRPPVPTFAGDRERFEFSAEASKALKDFARARRCTLFTLLYTGFGALLHRLSGTRDVLIGVPVAGQNIHKAGSLVGHCVHYLPTRHIVAPDTPFEQHLRRSGSELIEAFEHPRLTLGQLVRDLKWTRDPARPAPLGITFTLDPALKQIAFDGLEWNVSLNPRSALSGDICFNLIDRPEGIVVECSYATDLFSRTTIARWMRHYATLLDAAMHAPGTPVGRLPLLDVEQRTRILETWNPPASATPEPGLLHRLVEQRAARAPEAEAVRMGEQSLTYRELEMHANRLARHLVALGAGPDRCVAVLMDRSIDFAIAALGVLKSGSAYVPIDPAWPTERQIFVLRDCSARVLVTAGLSRPEGAPTDTPQIDLVKERDFLARLPSKPVAAEVEPRHMAYVIYTSGSTGQPKGVMIEHRAIAAHIPSIARAYGLSAEDRSLFFHSVAFDPAVEQLFAPLCAGGTVIIRGDVLWTGRDFSAEIRKQKLTVAILPPLYWLQMLRDWEEEPGLAPIEQLRLVVVGGEMMPESAVRLWRQMNLTSIRVINDYGPTECTVTATVHALPTDPAQDIPSGRVPIGRPHGPVEAYLLDAHLQPVPVGVPGEICLAGPTLARGYLGRDALTRAHFIAHPFREGARMYRTGDHGRFLEDGTIEFLGRLDRQVKIRGYRIELGEIETILGRAAGVRACAVAPEKAPDGLTRLAAYYVPAGPDTPVEEKLLAELRAQLPAYSVPARFVRVDALPQTVNGKLDFTALAAAGNAQPASEAEAELAARASELTGRVATILAEAAGIDRLASHENFFDSGGHSLVALRAIARLNREFDGRLTLSDVFQAPTAAGLADRLANAGGAVRTAIESLATTTAAPSEGPLLSAQRSLWFLDRLEPESGFYNTVHAVRMRGDLDRAALSVALDALVARHSALRSIFPDHDGEPVQVVQPARAVAIANIDISREPSAVRDDAVQRVLRAEVDRPFALDRDMLLRVVLVRVASGDHVLMLSTHHIAADGWSFDVMFEDLAELYRAAAEKRSPALASEGRTPLELAIDEVRWLTGPDAARQLVFWKEHLAGAPRELPLPFDLPRTQAATVAGGSHTFELDRALMDEVRRLARREDATLFMTFLAALGSVLRRWSGANDLVIGTPAALRDQSERDRTVGMLVNTVPIRLRPTEGKLFADLLRETREAARAVFDHRDYPFDLLVEKLGGRRSTRHPLFQVLFTMGADFGSTRNWRKLDVSPIALESSSTKFELTLSVTETANGARVTFEYMRDLFSSAMIAKLGQMFVEVLMAAVDRASGDKDEGRTVSVATKSPPVPVTTTIPMNASVDLRLGEIWRELLGTAEVRAESDFFDSGGHSLLAIRLFSRIEREFGAKIPVRELFDDATFGGLVARIRQRATPINQEAPPRELRFAFPLQRQGERAPLFLFTGSHGSEEEYLELNALVRALGKDQPVYGMRMGGHDRLRPQFATTEEMAASVALEIRQLQPAGPYNLAGECIGGRLAFEVARQLELAGQTISFLGLFDAECPRKGDVARFWIRDHWMTDLYRRFLKKIRWMPKIPVGGLPRYVVGRAYWAMWRAMKALTPAPVLPDRMPVRALEYYYARALIRYRAQPISSAVTFFMSEEFPLVGDPMQWAAFAHGGVRVVDLEGDHLASLRENAATSAARLRACLEAASAAQPPLAPRTAPRRSPALRKYLSAG